MLPRATSLARILDNRRFAAQLAHTLDALAHLTKQRYEQDVVALGEDFRCECAVFVW